MTSEAAEIPSLASSAEKSRTAGLRSIAPILGSLASEMPAKGLADSARGACDRDEFPAKCHAEFVHYRKSFADPVEIGVANVAPVVKGDFADSTGAKCSHRLKEFAFCLEIGEGGTQDATKGSCAAQPTL